MIVEYSKAKAFFIKKFGSMDKIKPGVYSIPIKTDTYEAYLKVVVSSDKKLSDFGLYKDKGLNVGLYE